LTFKKSKNSLPIFPILLGIYPVISLMAGNILEIYYPIDALRSIVVALLGTILLYICLWLLLRDGVKSALICGLLVGLFHSYGHVYWYLMKHPIGGLVLGRHRFLIPIWIGLGLLGVWLIIRKWQPAATAIWALNVVSIALFILPLFQLGNFFWVNLQSNFSGANKAHIVEHLQKPDQGALPDIYYIILDMYGRDDSMQQYLGFDNSEFLAQLEDLGFYVARCSRSNYLGSHISITSALAMDYLKSFDEVKPRLSYHIPDSLVQVSLQELGYKIVAFETGYPWSEIRTGDVYLTPTSIGKHQYHILEPVNGFETLLINYSAGFTFYDFLHWIGQGNGQTTAHVNRQLFVLDELQALPEMAGPKFVFAHVLIPHQPFVFSPAGVKKESDQYEVGEDALTSEVYRKGYVDQVKYLNQRLIPILNTIIKESKTPPIIILQGDHGFQIRGERLYEILNAYYLPDGGNQKLYANISPVNSFRVVFDTYFNSHYGLLKDNLYLKEADTRPGCQ